MVESHGTLKRNPVVFLAFANDRVRNRLYLRNLPNEHRGIRDHLSKAENAGLCEVVERANASVDDILNVFQDNAYKDRVAVFHYGGHADGFKLLLETFKGGCSPAFRDGLVSFLARQKGLKLIFLNGCSTEQHALALIEAGIPAVIATSQLIHDEIACKLAVRFYNGVANGLPLADAWHGAQDQIKIQKDASNFHHLYRLYCQKESCCPWKIHYNEHAEQIKEWTLPGAANDHLFGLPPIPQSHTLPSKPFLFLERYQRRHAEVFFGRSRYIRELYNRVTHKQSPPIILLYGQSGVGKSSLLEAGLLPRLEAAATVSYLKRKPDSDLSKTLSKALNEHLSPVKDKAYPDRNTISEKWRRIETQTGKPLVVVVDQLENIYTHSKKPLNNELDECLDALKPLFDNPSLYPVGKLIFGYRKEFHPEIEAGIKHLQLEFSPIFLQPLERSDIIEVVTGLTRSKRLRDRFNLKVDEQLPVIIADNLLEDGESPVAPVLQIILTKMWDDTQKDRVSRYPEFTLERYRALRRDGMLMSDFFDQQMQKLSYLNSETVESGLALDLLKFHTSPLGTACSRRMEDILDIYFHRRESVAELVGQLKRFYLLTDANHDNGQISLAHDTLAPIVINAYNDSYRPGRRAARILSAKLEEFKKDKTDCYLNEADMLIVEQGRKGMRNLTPLEKELLEESRKRKMRRVRNRKRDKGIRSLLIIIVILSLLVVIWIRHFERMASAHYSALRAQSLASSDPTVALRMAAKACEDHENPFTRASVDNIYWNNIFYKIIAHPQKTIITTAFSQSAEYSLMGFQDGTAQLRDWEKKTSVQLENNHSLIVCAAFSGDDAIVVTGSINHTICQWDLKGNLMATFTGHTGGINGITVSPDGRNILSGSNDGTARLWTIAEGQSIHLKPHQQNMNSVTSVAFSSDWEYSVRGYIVTGSSDQTARLFNSKGKFIRDFRGYDGRVMCIDIAAIGGMVYILTGTDRGNWSLWRKDKDKPEFTLKHNGQVNSVGFSPDGQYILTNSYEKNAVLWDLKGNKRYTLIGHKSSVLTSIFSPDGRYILTASDDNTVRKWQITDKGLDVFRGVDKSIHTAAFYTDKKNIITGSHNGVVRLWNIINQKSKILYGQGYPLTSFSVSTGNKYILMGLLDGSIRLVEISTDALGGRELWSANHHKAEILDSAFSMDGRFILTGSADNTVCLWEMTGKRKKDFKGHNYPVTAVAFSHNGKYILTGSSDSTAWLWDIEGTKKKEFNGHTHSITSIAFLPDDRYILTGSDDNTAVLWDIDGNQLTRFVGHKDIVHSVAFSPNDNNMYILTGSADKTARLWNREGEQLQVFSGHDNAVYSVAFSPDGARILTGSGDGSVRLWKIGAWRDFLENNECQKFSDDQLNEYAGKN